MPFTISKAVIPVAGLGTRFLPATKAMPKEMLPVVDKPAIQYVVEEAVAAGLHDVLMVTGRNKTGAREPLRPGRRARGRSCAARARATSSRRSSSRPTSPTCTTCGRATRWDSATRCCAREDARRARAVRRAARRRHHRRARPAADPDAAGAGRAQHHRGRAARGRPVDRAPLRHRDGRADRGGRRRAGHRARREARRPAPRPRTSRSSAGTCCAPRSSTCSRTPRPARAARSSSPTRCRRWPTGPEWTGGVYGVVFRGRRYDTGDRLDYLKAIVQLASDRDDLGPEFRPWLRDFAATLSRRST